MRSALVIFLVNYCALLFSQNIIYSRKFDTRRKLIPLQIINNHPDYFHVLRKNKLSHDLTIERRLKPTGQIAAFTPLKLDSVNANWFDYEKLEYLFSEYNHRAYFVFEKTLNTKKTVYLKIIDSTGKSTGFIELATLDYDKSTTFFDFKFIINKNKLLIVGSQDYINQTSKKVALLYDLEKREKIWIKKLPLENPSTGYSREHRINQNNDLFYILANAREVGVKRRFINNMQVFFPVFSYDFLALASIPHDSLKVHEKTLSVFYISELKSFFVNPGDVSTTVLANLKMCDTSTCNLFFLAESFNNNLDTTLASRLTSLNPRLTEKLTFYDGTDYKQAAEKDYALVDVINQSGYAYYLAGRSDANYYKELLFWKINLANGEVVQSEIIPRKIFFFDDRTRFKNRGNTSQQVHNGTFYCFVSEDSGNLDKLPRNFKFHKFARQKYLWQANLVAYIIRPDGNYEKKVVHNNGHFDFVPLDYSSNQSDFIFYLNNSDEEQFAILKLDGF